MHLMRKKSVLITGIAGFIGYHAALALQDVGDHVVGIDSFSDYYDIRLKMRRKARLEARGISLFSGDICDTPLLKTCLKKHQITHVLHLAAQAGVRASFTHPDPYVHTNLAGFVSLLEALKELPQIPLVYASSSSVYGCNESLPFREEDRVEQPNNLYAASKRCAEILARSYHELYDLNVCGLRYFTVYGPFGRPDMAYYTFAQNLLKGEPLLLRGRGKMQRDFTYIDDIVAGTLAALDRSQGYSIYNLASHHPKSVSYLVELLEEGFGKRGKKQLLPMPKGELPTTYGSIENAQKDLGYTPQISLEAGIIEFVRWASDAHEQGIFL